MKNIKDVLAERILMPKGWSRLDCRRVTKGIVIRLLFMQNFSKSYQPFVNVLNI